MAQTKHHFSGVPMRAMGDERLSAVDFRVLMAIAAHDRMKANGIGCYASHPRLASLAACHIKSLSRSLRTLADYGYVTGRANPLNQRTRIYNVVYTDFDAAYLKAGGVEIGNEPATYPASKGNVSATIPARKGNEFATPIGQIGNKVLEEAQQKQGATPVNILGETLIYPGEPVLKNPAEAAPAADERALDTAPVKSAGAILGTIERDMKAGRVKSWQLPWLQQFSHGGAEHIGSEHQWARRLRAELEGRLNAASA